MAGHELYPGDVVTLPGGERVLLKARDGSYATVVHADRTIDAASLAGLTWTGECLASQPRTTLGWREAARLILAGDH